MEIKDKKVLVTGGTGMIGTELVQLLVKKGARVKVVSNEDKIRSDHGVEFEYADLRSFEDCLRVCKGMDIVFNMIGVKGSPKMAKERPASFFVPMLQFDTNMMEAARLCDVEWYLYTSSMGVYKNFDSVEDEVWDTFPSENDWFAGWAKRMGELQAEAYKIQYGWDKVSIVRPANVFGGKDNFDPETAMVIPSLISRIEEGENPLKVWGDGSALRDFIFAGDVAKICCYLVENEITEPVNAATGKGVSIKELVETIVQHTKNKPEIVWDTTKPSGDPKRVLNVDKLKSLGFNDFSDLTESIKKVVDWYNTNKELVDKRYDAFKE
jgi:GDP-L-fucose synthase